MSDKRQTLAKAVSSPLSLATSPLCVELLSLFFFLNSAPSTWTGNNLPHEQFSSIVTVSSALRKGASFEDET